MDEAVTAGPETCEVGRGTFPGCDIAVLAAGAVAGSIKDEMATSTTVPVRIQVEVELPADMAGLMLPEGVDRRLHALLDKQERGDALTEDEAAEAEGLVDLADLLSLIRLRASSHDSPAQ